MEDTDTGPARRLPRNYAPLRPVSTPSTNIGEDENQPYYIFKRRGCLPLTRSLWFTIFIEAYEKILQLEDNWVLGSLFYLLYLPFGLVAFGVAEFAFVIWFDIMCQPIIVPLEKTGIYGRGLTFALQKPEEDDHLELEPGSERRKQRPTTTCLWVYNSCLETQEVESDDEEEDEANDNDVEQGDNHEPPEPSNVHFDGAGRMIHPS